MNFWVVIAFIPRLSYGSVPMIVFFAHVVQSTRLCSCILHGHAIESAFITDGATHIAAISTAGVKYTGLSDICSYVQETRILLTSQMQAAKAQPTKPSKPPMASKHATSHKVAQHVT